MPTDDATLPLCVDLDGTLIRTDMLVDGVLALWRSPALYRALAVNRSRAAFKQAIAAVVPFDPAKLPYNQELLAYLREQKAKGRYLALVTASHAHVAAPIAQHLALFDTVIASEGDENVKGPRKAARLVERFGPQGFVYAGDAHADLNVWSKAAAAILVNTNPATTAAARTLAPIEREFHDPMRPRQRIHPKTWPRTLLTWLASR